MSKSIAESVLFSPLRVGALSLPNRMVMAPMTRGRNAADGTPSELLIPYYSSRADAGLLITEATAISTTARGWLGAPGIHAPSHVEGWRRVTDSVHRAGGRIFCQLWHMGRVSHPDFLDGALPVAPSAIAAKGSSHTPKGKQDYVIPRALSVAEIGAIVGEYAQATKLAREAGFDGIELHGANGYLIDQFLRDGSNQRSDAYGGTPAKRARFLLEVVDAVSAAWAKERIGVRISPTGNYNDMRDSDPQATFTHVARELAPRGLAYLHVTEALPGSPMHVPLPPVTPAIRSAYPGTLIVNGGYDAKTAAAAIEGKQAELVAFGVPFLANPDLVKRFQRGATLNAPDFATLYTPGAKGYTDYPTLG